MMNTILFTIIIPTYNRCQMLDESLQMVLPQVRKFEKDVRLYVSDNASTDETESVINKYLIGNEDILTYYKQSENIGGQNNFRHAVKAVNSKYVCLLGDDDVVFPNFVENIVELLKMNPDVGLVNFNVTTVSYDLRNADMREKDIRDLRPVIYANGKDFIYDHLELPSLISSNVFYRDNFLKWLDKVSVGTYPGYDWFAILYKSMINKKCIFCGLPLLLQRMPNTQRWAVDAPYFTIYGFGKIFKELTEDIPGLYDHWKDYCQKEYRGTLNYILRIVSDNKELYKQRFETMRPYMCSLEYERQFQLRLYHSNRYVDFVNAPIRFVYTRIRMMFSRVFTKIKR